jgi:DNA-directed RNA polymerase specialized sigma24 family protein
VSVRPFESVVADHGPVVHRVVRALLGPVDADDAWSETFLAALEAYPRLRPDSDVRAWLVTIAHRKAVDRLRASSRAPVASGDVGASAGGVEVGFDDAVAGRDPALWAALAALPFKQRAAVAYHHVAGLPYAEVGALIGSSEVAARRSASDGLAALRRTWTREEAS